MQLLLIRDELHVEQDAMLVDVEDLTRWRSLSYPVLWPQKHTHIHVLINTHLSSDTTNTNNNRPLFVLEVKCHGTSQFKKAFFWKQVTIASFLKMFYLRRIFHAFFNEAVFCCSFLSQACSEPAETPGRENPLQIKPMVTCPHHHLRHMTATTNSEQWSTTLVLESNKACRVLFQVSTFTPDLTD